MTVADTASARPNGRSKDFTAAVSKAADKVAGKVSEPVNRLQRIAKTRSITLKGPNKPMHLETDRVRAKPAVSPTLSMNIGMTAIGLGIWGMMFPNSVKRALGVTAPTPVVQTIFGLREMITGVTLASDPTKSWMLWARVAGDAFDIAMLTMLDTRKNPSRGGARLALGFVLAVTALDLVTAVRMTNVKRNCE
jgi:hypothetical protein